VVFTIQIEPSRSGAGHERVGRQLGIDGGSLQRLARERIEVARRISAELAHQVEGELRGREYEEDGLKHQVFECRLESILKLDR
jgi:hypothetical protein